MKELWIRQQEEICDDYALGIISEEEALNKLVQMGFDPLEALDLCAKAVA